MIYLFKEIPRETTFDEENFFEDLSFSLRIFELGWFHVQETPLITSLKNDPDEIRNFIEARVKGFRTFIDQVDFLLPIYAAVGISDAAKILITVAQDSVDFFQKALERLTEKNASRIKEFIVKLSNKNFKRMKSAVAIIKLNCKVILDENAEKLINTVFFLLNYRKLSQLNDFFARTDFTRTIATKEDIRRLKKFSTDYTENVTRLGGMQKYEENGSKKLIIITGMVLVAVLTAAAVIYMLI